MKQIMDEYGETVIYMIIAGVVTGFFLSVLQAATIC